MVLLSILNAQPWWCSFYYCHQLYSLFLTIYIPYLLQRIDIWNLWWLEHPQVVMGLWAGAVVGSWCNFLTVMYIGERPAFFSSVDRICWPECLLKLLSWTNFEKYILNFNYPTNVCSKNVNNWNYENNIIYLH